MVLHPASAHGFTSAPAPYPVDALGPHLAPVVCCIAEATQVPVELAAQAVLAVGSLAVQGHASVRVLTGEIRPVTCFFLIIAESGSARAPSPAWHSSRCGSARKASSLQPRRRAAPRFGNSHKRREAEIVACELCESCEWCES
jgi:hypothetical protein